MLYFLSRKNKFLVWPPGICPRSARDCSTVNKGGCFTVVCSIPKESSSAKSCSGVFGIPAIIQRTCVNIRGDPMEVKMMRILPVAAAVTAFLTFDAGPARAVEGALVCVYQPRHGQCL